MRIKGASHDLTRSAKPKNDPRSSTKAIAPSVKELLRVASKAEKATRDTCLASEHWDYMCAEWLGGPSKGATWLDGTLTRRQARLAQEQSH